MNRYILALKPEYSSSRGMFSMPEHRGYTNDLNEAGRYSAEEALKTQDLNPDKYVAIPLAVCEECRATSPKEAEALCNCSGDKDDCHGCYIWPD